jgi:hypothetical protein
MGISGVGVEAYASGAGVYGVASGSSGKGVSGYALNAGSVINYGGHFEAAGNQGRGVYGGNQGRGVYGYASNTASTTTYGGYFTAASTSGRGVYGRASGTSAQAVHAYASALSGTNYGVFSKTRSPDGYAGHFEGGRNYFEGNVGIGTNEPVAKVDILDDQQQRGLNVVSSYSETLGQLVNIERTEYSGLTADNDLLQIKVPSDAPDGIQFIECESGSDIKFRVWGDGDVTADGSIRGGGADFAEMVIVTNGHASVQPGDVMVIDPNNAGSVILSSEARSRLVAGIYSTKPGFIASKRDWDQIALARSAADGHTSDKNEETPSYTLDRLAAEVGEIPLAVVGIVPCKVSTENGVISPGDLIVTSSIPGHAMRDDNPAVGTVVGKALGSLSSGTGTIEILVTLQ